MQTKKLRRSGILSIGLATAAVGIVANTAAGLTSAGSDSVATSNGFEVIARGLDSPRGISFDRRGVMYVAEAGRGGTGPCNTGPGGQRFCVGATGGVTAVRHGWQKRIVSGLPSYGNETQDFVLGPHDVMADHGGALKILVGLGLAPARLPELGTAGANLARLLESSPSGRWRPIADLGRYELENNPDRDVPGSVVESDPYGLLVEGRTTYATDAAGNSLLKIDERGRISTVAVFPDQRDPATGAMVDAVPTSVVRGPDGALYLGQLTGYPYPAGQANVFRIMPGRAPTVYASGFTNVLDIAFDKRGRLLVLEMSSTGFLTPNGREGALKRVDRPGNVTVLAREGLVYPSSVAIGPDGDIYISNRGRSVGSGEVLRLNS